MVEDELVVGGRVLMDLFGRGRECTGGDRVDPDPEGAQLAGQGLATLLVQIEQGHLHTMGRQEPRGSLAEA